MSAVLAPARVAAAHPAVVRVTTTEYEGEDVAARRVAVRVGHAHLALYAALGERLRPWALPGVLAAIAAQPPEPGEATVYAWFLDDRFELEIEVLPCPPDVADGADLDSVADELAADQRAAARCAWLS